MENSSTSQLADIPDDTEAGEGEPDFADREEGHGTLLHLCIVWWLSREGFFPSRKQSSPLVTGRCISLVRLWR